MELTAATAIVGACCAVVSGAVGALGGLYASRSWAEARFRAASECERTHDGVADASSALRQTVAGLGDRVEGLAIQVQGLDRTVAVLGERLGGAFARWDAGMTRLDALAAAGCPYGGRGKEGC